MDGSKQNGCNRQFMHEAVCHLPRTVYLTRGLRQKLRTLHGSSPFSMLRHCRARLSFRGRMSTSADPHLVFLNVLREYADVGRCGQAVAGPDGR